MLEVVLCPWEKQFMSFVANAKQDIMLCAPFIKADVIKKILKHKNKEVTLTVFTNASIANYVRKSSDIEAIESLLDHQVVVYDFERLHAKVYLFDEKEAVITSGNLTYSGFQRNFEYGVLLDDHSIIQQITKDYDDAKGSRLCMKLSKKKLLEMKSLIEANRSSKVYTDETGDDVLEIENVEETLSKIISKDGWKKDVLKVLFQMERDCFSLKDVLVFVPDLQRKHPNNKNVEAKVRQALQQLRDLKLLKFVSRGKYKRLFRVSLK